MSIFFKQKAPDRVYFINKIVYYTLKGVIKCIYRQEEGIIMNKIAEFIKKIEKQMVLLRKNLRFVQDWD